MKEGNLKHMEGKTKKVGLDLTQGPVLRELLIFVGPVIIANLIQQLYSLVDLVVIGAYMGSTGTVGVSTGGEMADMLMPVAQALGAAGQIYIAQLLGAREHKKLKETIGTMISFMILTSLVFFIIIIVFRIQILNLLNCPAEAFSQADQYVIWTAIGYPFIFGYNAVAGILQGMGESKRPLLFIVIAATVNIFLDILLVGPFHMESAGAAIATTASQAASFIASLVYMYQHREHFEFELKPAYFRIRWSALKVILSLGIPQACRSLLVRFSMLYVNASVNAYGLVESATNSVGNKLQKFLEIYTSSFSQAGSAMVAQNLGAKKPERAKKTVLYSFYSCLILAAVTSAIIVIWPKPVFGIFTHDANVLSLGVIYLQILVVHIFLSAMTSSFQTMVIGSGNAKLNFLIGVLDGVICKIGLSLIFVYLFDMGVYGFFCGTALSRLLPGLMNVWYFCSGRWNRRKLLNGESQ